MNQLLNLLIGAPAGRRGARPATAPARRPSRLDGGTPPHWPLLPGRWPVTAGTCAPPDANSPTGKPASPAPLVFTAETAGRAAVLRWTTTPQLPGARFELEVAADGQPCVVIATVAATAGADTCTHYQLTDARLSDYGAAQVTYRLRCLGADGSVLLAAEQAVPTPTNAAARLRVYPAVAAGGSVRYAYQGPPLPCGATLELCDEAGRCVSRLPGAVAGALPVRRLVPGWYWVRLLTGSGVVQARLYQA